MTLRFSQIFHRYLREGYDDRRYTHEAKMRSCLLQVQAELVALRMAEKGDSWLYQKVKEVSDQMKKWLDSLDDQTYEYDCGLKYCGI